MRTTKWQQCRVFQPLSLVETKTPTNSENTLRWSTNAHKNNLAQLPKMRAKDTEQPSSPLHPPKVGGLLSHFDKYKSLCSRIENRGPRIDDRGPRNEDSLRPTENTLADLLVLKILLVLASRLPACNSLCQPADIYDSVCLLLVSFCWRVPLEFLWSFLYMNAFAVLRYLKGRSKLCICIKATFGRSFWLPSNLFGLT